MIAVIADDFTGAAEIGGVALRNGYRAVIETEITKNTDADILIIATDTRSENATAARKTIARITRQLEALKPGLVYKKMDSVFRGNPGEELLEQLAVSDKQRALLVPANPSLKRVIRNGVYWYRGIPIAHSDLAGLPDKGRLSSSVLDLIGKNARPDAAVISVTDPLPDKKLIIGNALTGTDLLGWARRIDAGTLPAGGSEFFHAILMAGQPPRRMISAPPFRLGRRALYVCGSDYPGSRIAVAEARRSGRYVSNMPEGMFCTEEQNRQLTGRWVEDIVSGIAQGGAVIMAVDQIACRPPSGDLPGEIRKITATAVEKVMQRVKIDELLIEGGATAASVTAALNYRRLYPHAELTPGVIRMKAAGKDDVFLTVKPGSYAWPETVWK